MSESSCYRVLKAEIWLEVRRLRENFWKENGIGGLERDCEETIGNVEGDLLFQY